MKCISLFIEDFHVLGASLAKYGKYIDCIEFRTDSGDMELLQKCINSVDKQIIITCRRKGDGGEWNASENERIEFLKKCYDMNPDYLDVEEDVADEFAYANPDNLIVSLHTDEFDENRFRAVLEKHNNILVKIVCQAQSWTTNSEVINFLKSADRKLIMHCSGNKGLYSRLLASEFGSALTYFSLEGARPTGDAQVTVNHAIDVLRLDRLKKSPKVFGIAGNPIGHSLSPILHNRIFELNSVNALYLPFHVEQFNEFFTFVNEEKLDGLSITHPFKGVAYGKCMESDASAQALGSINTLVLKDNLYRGFNTDGSGFYQYLLTRNFDPRGRNILIIGPGGAGLAIAQKLSRSGSYLYSTSRSRIRHQGLSIKMFTTVLKDPDDSISFDLIINATPVKADDAEQVEAISRWLQPNSFAIDIKYSKDSLWFLAKADELGCTTDNGLGMFLEQGLLQSFLWTGIEATNYRRELHELIRNYNASLL